MSTWIAVGGPPNGGEEIVFNAKTQRPSVCNAAEKLLVHRRVAAKALPRIIGPAACCRRGGPG